MLGVVVGSLRIFTVVKTGIPPHPLVEISGLGIHQTVEVERRQTLAVVNPVEHHRKLPVVHTVPGERHLRRLRLGVLPQVALPTQLAHGPQLVPTSKDIEQRPAHQVLDGVVRPVVSPPARNALQITALVEVVLEKLGTGPFLGADQFPFHQRPRRWRHRRVDIDVALLQVAQGISLLKHGC